MDKENGGLNFFFKKKKKGKIVVIGELHKMVLA